MKQHLISTLVLFLFWMTGIQAQTISASPNTAYLNDEYLEVTISGVDTQFESGTSCGDMDINSIVFSQGTETIYVEDLYVYDDDLLYLALVIPTNQPTGSYDIDIFENGPEGCAVSCPDCFQVLPPPQGIFGVYQSWAFQGDEIKVTVTGQNTYWSQATPCAINAGNVFFSQGTSTIITPASVEILAPDTLCLYMNIPDDINIGNYDVTVGAGLACEDTCEGCFDIHDPSPSYPNITGLQPDSGYQGEELKVTISGEDTYWGQASHCSVNTQTIIFVQGSSTIVPTNVVITDPDTICVFIDIPEDINTGHYDIYVGLQPDCMTYCEDCFEVLSDIELLADSQGGQGQQDNQIELRTTNGSFSGCEYTTQNVFLQLGNEIIYPSTLETVNDELIFSFDIAEDALLGNYDIVIGDGLDDDCNFTCTACYEITTPPQLDIPGDQIIGFRGFLTEWSIGLTSGTFDECLLTTENVYLILGDEIIYPTTVEIIDNELHTVFDLPINATQGEYNLIVGEGLDGYGCYHECIGCFIVDEFASVDQAFEASISLYPNPFDDRIQINAETVLNDVNLQMYDATGKLVYDNHISQLQNETIQLSDLPIGIYFLRIISAEGEAYKRVMRH